MSGLVDTIFGGSCLGPNDSNVQFHIPSSYGYVVLVGISSFCVHIWQCQQIKEIRQKYKIVYPTMYSEDNVLFNCYQRAHQHTLENLPTFLALLAWGGLEMPVFCAIAGIIWLAGRIIFSKGYYTGNEQKRLKGSFGNIGTLMLLIANMKFAIKLIIW